MWGGAQYLAQQFSDLDREQAKQILFYWMQSFATRHKK
jgi:hypothetical protein